MEQAPSPTAAPPEKHPEEVDPLGRQHPQPHISTEEKRMTSILSIFLVATIVAIPIISVTSSSPAMNVFLGFLPLIVTLVLDMIAVSHHYKTTVLWINLAAVHVLALAVLYFCNYLLSVPLNIGAAVSTSVLLGLIATTFVVLTTGRVVPKHEHVVEFNPEKIEEYVQSIEDKAKAINFVVGRVYRAANGGTAKMRERLRVPSEWYNEFTEIKDPGEQLDKAKVLVRKIRDRLALYTMKEKEAFSSHELSALKHLARDKAGNDDILTVLKTNDRDPVEHYYVSAVEFCDRILQELEK